MAGRRSRGLGKLCGYVCWLLFATTKAHAVRPFGQLGWTQKIILSAIGTQTTILTARAFQLPKLHVEGSSPFARSICRVGREIGRRG